MRYIGLLGIFLSTVCFAGWKIGRVTIATNSPQVSFLDDQSNADGTTVTCGDGITNCQFQDPMFPPPNNQPAVLFRVPADATIHIEADIWLSGTGCPGTPDATAVGDLALPAGDDIVFLEFTPPPPTGTPLSLAWRIDGCGQTACFNHTIGVSPGLCLVTKFVCQNQPDVAICTDATSGQQCTRGDGTQGTCQTTTLGCACTQ